MKKYLSWITALLVVFAPFFYQWLRMDVEIDRLNARTYELVKELAKIDKVRSNLPFFEKRIVETDQQIELLQQRIPPGPGEEIFVKELIDRFKKHNVELDYYYSDSVDKDFYKEIGLVFVYKHENVEESLLSEIFRNMDRLVRWEKNEQDKVVVVRIYSSLLGKDMPRIKPCWGTGKESMNYWPFNTLVRKKLNQVEALCSKRNKNEALLAKIKLFESRLRLFEMLLQIVSHLDPEPSTAI